MKAVSIPLSHNWDGNNGPWSSFAIQIGDPAQQISVLPATSMSNVWAVDPTLCPNLTAVGDCETFRGRLYRANESSTFAPILAEGNRPYITLPFGSEQPLGYEGAARFGTDKVILGGVGDDGDVLDKQAISAFSKTAPFLATGLLGLSNEPLPITEADNIVHSFTSPLSALQKSRSISSRFWAYNAGARWLEEPVYASLTLGGYDTARRGDPKDVVTMRMQPAPLRNLVVTIQYLGIGGAAWRLPPGTNAFIDSVVPEIWLPESVCSHFEEAFDLQWNETAQMYLLDRDQAERLIQQNSTLQFQLADPGAGDTMVAITLPIKAFILQAKYPLAGIKDDSIQLYFPLKRTNSSSQYTLGHTFLQAAYLAVDYDRSEFQLSQAHMTNEASIMTVYPPGQGGGLSAGEIAGIAVGVVMLLLIVASMVAWYVCRPRWKKRRNSRYRAKVEAQNYGLPDTQLPNSPEMEMHEYYAKRPLSPESDHKQELDATTTARGSTTSRAEMESPSQSSLGSPRGKGTPRRSSYGFPASPAELESRSPRMMHSRTASGSSIEPMSPLSGVGRRGLEPHEEVHEMP